MPTSATTTYLHIGPPKTGTTYLQDVLWRNKKALRRHGYHVPGSQMDHFQAALDLREMAFGGYDDPRTRGAWDRIVASAHDSRHDKLIVTHELLAGATVEQIRRAVDSLAPATVEVVYGARDLGRQLPGMWQENLKNASARPFRKMLSTTLAVERPSSLPNGFWRSQDPVGVLERWASAVPPARIHVVTVPQRGAPREELWSRFCAAVGVRNEGFDLDVRRPNRSLGIVDAEVLRRLNKHLADALEWPDYERLVKHVFNQRANRTEHPPPILVPRRHREAVLAQSRRIATSLATSGYDIVGSLGELTPGDDAFGPNPAKPVRVADAAAELLASFVVEKAGNARGICGDRARALLASLRR
ncbi:MAG: hypothetical protein ACRDPG_02915 [Nocardioidaceae bacterium]